MAHGTHDQWTMWTPIGGDENYEKEKSSPTTKHTTYNAKYAYKTGADLAVEKTVICGINATYKAASWLTLLAQADLVSIKNYGNKEGVDAKDFQVVLSARFLF